MPCMVRALRWPAAEIWVLPCACTGRPELAVEWMYPCNLSRKICLPTRKDSSMPMAVPIVVTRNPHQKPRTAETRSMTGVDERNTTGNTDMAARAMPAT